VQGNKFTQNAAIYSHRNFVLSTHYTTQHSKVLLALTGFWRHYRGVGCYRLASSASPKLKIKRRGIALSTCRACNDCDCFLQLGSSWIALWLERAVKAMHHENSGYRALQTKRSVVSSPEVTLVRIIDWNHVPSWDNLASCLSFQASELSKSRITFLRCWILVLSINNARTLVFMVYD